jgi:hypothetical protein
MTDETAPPPGPVPAAPPAAYRIEGGRVVFDPAQRAALLAARQGIGAYMRGASPWVALTAPVIYAGILPLVALDLFLTLFQGLCFPAHGITRVRRRDHIVIDRHLLPYLNAVQKLNCVYCGYANGLLSYAREIASRTEARWCPIRHARAPSDPHGRMADFAAYGDPAGRTGGGGPAA